MPRTKASNEAQYRYNKNHLKRIPLDVQLDYYNEKLKPAADKVNEPVNTYIKNAIQQRIDREK